MADICGIIPALITPFTSEGKVNETSLREIVRLNISKGVDGFYVCGSTGEAFLLSIEERKRILEIVHHECAGKCRIICHIGCISTYDAIELAIHAQKTGVDAIASVPPFYYKYTIDEISKYYEDILEYIDIPIIVYNFPANTGILFSLDNFKDLFKNSQIIGIKHTSSDLYQLERLKHIKKELIIYSGYDEVFLGALAMGADGAIGSTFNIMADKFITIYNFFKEGKLTEALEYQRKVNGIIEILINVGVIPGIKYILELLGIQSGNCRKPFRPLTEEQKYILKKQIDGFLI